MDGPLVLWIALAVVLPLLWVYRRFFEARGAREPNFETWARSEPLLVVATCADAERLVSALQAILSPERECVASLAPYPWQHYKLRVQVVAAGNHAVVRLKAVRPLRTHDSLPDLLNCVFRAVEACGCTEERVWAHARLYRDPLSTAPCPPGWLVRRSPAGRVRFEPGQDSTPGASIGAGRHPRPAQECAVESAVV
jgi:hypothetical protein